MEVCHHRLFDVGLHHRRVLDVDRQGSRQSARSNDGLSDSLLSTHSVSSGGCLKWHDTLWTLRHLLFTALPLIAHFVLPASFIASPLAIVPQTNLALQALHQRVQLLKFTTSVTLRVPEFRETAGNYWETQRTEGKWAREDEAINRLAEKTSTGTKREVASELVATLKRGLEPALGL